MNKLALYEWHILCRNGETLGDVADKPVPRSRCRKAFRRFQRELDRLGEWDGINYRGVQNSFFAWVNTDGTVEFIYDDFDHFHKQPHQLNIHLDEAK